MVLSLRDGVLQLGLQGRLGRVGRQLQVHLFSTATMQAQEERRYRAWSLVGRLAGQKSTKIEERSCSVRHSSSSCIDTCVQRHPRAATRHLSLVLDKNLINVWWRRVTTATASITMTERRGHHQQQDSSRQRQSRHSTVHDAATTSTTTTTTSISCLELNAHSATNTTTATAIGTATAATTPTLPKQQHNPTPTRKTTVRINKNANILKRAQQLRA